MDGDGRLEAVLLDVLPPAKGADAATASRPAAWRPGPAARTVAVLGIRSTAAGGFGVDVLHRAKDVTGSPHADRDHAAGRWANELFGQRLTPAGKEPAPGIRDRTTVVWVRYQDPDCRNAGWQWTVRAERWVLRASTCSGGD